MQTRKPQMSEADKSRILTLVEEHFSIREISRRVGRNECVVRKFLKKFRTSGITERKPGSGRPKRLNNRNRRNLKTLVARNRFASAAELLRELPSTSSANISVRTVQRELNSMGFASRKAAKKPLLSAIMRKRRLDWAKAHQNWTADDWRRVIFSDESRFNIGGQDGSRLVRRRKGERFHRDCIISTVKHPASLMIWGCITSYGVGELLIVDGTMNAAKYAEVIKTQIKDTYEHLTEHTSEPIFQDDSAPCHRAKSISDLKQQLGITLLTWPANSLDLNPIENVWGMMGLKLRDYKPRTTAELDRTLKDIWEKELTKEYLEKLYDSMPNRIKEVITAKGGATRY